MRVVPKAWSVGVIEKITATGYEVALPYKNRKLYQVFKPDQLRLLS